MEAEFNHLNHATWECKYHVVFTPKYRKKVLFGKIKRQLGQVFHDLARRKECRIEEGHLMPDHVHMLISIPPKYSVAQIIGYMKGKSSIWIAQNVERKMRNFLGHKFWAASLAGAWDPAIPRAPVPLIRNAGIRRVDAERGSQRDQMILLVDQDGAQAFGDRVFV